MEFVPRCLDAVDLEGRARLATHTDYDYDFLLSIVQLQQTKKTILSSSPFEPSASRHLLVRAAKDDKPEGKGRRAKGKAKAKTNKASEEPAPKRPRKK